MLLAAARATGAPLPQAGRWRADAPGEYNRQVAPREELREKAYCEATGPERKREDQYRSKCAGTKNSNG
ncbi:hypothetical protein ACPA9J_02105 [Pseudomonas aeruginosa]